MTTKKAITLGILGAILIGLVSFAVTNKKYKPKTITSESQKKLIPEKKQITEEMTTNGWNFNINTYKIEGENQLLRDTPISTPSVRTKPVNLANTTWNINYDIDFTSFGFQNKVFNINISVGQADDRYQYIQIINQDNEKQICYNQNIVYNNGWTNTYNHYLTFLDGQAINNQILIDFIWQNATPEKYLYFENHEQKAENYLGIETFFASNKTFTSCTSTSESIFLMKLKSNGTTAQAILEKFRLLTRQPNTISDNKNRYPKYTTTLKFSKTTSIDNMNPYIWTQRMQFEQLYNSIQNKQNIYTGTYTLETSVGHTNWITDGIYSEEEGTRYLEARIDNEGLYWFTHGGQAESIDIKTQAKVQYIAIYCKTTMSNFYATPYPNDQYDEVNGTMLYGKIPIMDNIIGYGIGSNPVNPPDIEDGNFMSLTGLMMNILTMPFTFISQAFNLTLWDNTPWAFSIRNFILTIIAILAFMFIIKLFTSGFSAFGMFTEKRTERQFTKSKTKLNKQQAKINKEKINKPKKE